MLDQVVDNVFRMLILGQLATQNYLLNLENEDAPTLGIRHFEGSLNDIVGILAIHQVGQCQPAVGHGHTDDVIQQNFLFVIRRELEALLDDVTAELMQRKLHDIVEDLVNDVALVCVRAAEQHVGQHVVAELIEYQSVHFCF